jgi:protein involved in polysaccharide export with SLBB domain
MELLQHRGRCQSAVLRGNRTWAVLVFLAACRLFASDQPALEALGPTQSVTGHPTETTVKPSTTVSNAFDLDSTNGTALVDENYKLAVGDCLSFRIMEDEDDPKQLVVTVSGDLEVPYIGRFRAVGKTCKELARGLKAELEKEYYYRATVIIAVDTVTKMSASSRSPGKIYLVGAVRLVGPQEIPTDEVLTLSKAILRSGGFTDFADKRHVRVTRKQGSSEGDNKIYTVNVTEILEKGKTDLDLPLKPGDLIFVPDRVIRF